MTFRQIGRRASGCFAVLVASLWAVPAGSVRAQSPDVGTETAEPSGLMAKAKGAIRELGDEIRRGADELSAAARPTKNAGI